MTAAKLYKNEGMASKLEELEKRIRRDSNHESFIKALQEND